MALEEAFEIFTVTATGTDRGSVLLTGTRQQH